LILIKTKYASTNLVTFVDFITPLVCSQGQADAIYFALSLTLFSAWAQCPWAFRRLCKLDSQLSFGPATSSPCSPLLSKFSPVSLRDLFWDLSFSMCLLMTYVMQT
jgi:hypothetical protein